MAKAEKQSLEKTLDGLLAIAASERTTMVKDIQVSDEDIDNMFSEEMSKLSCKCLVRVQTYLYGQVASNRGSLQLIVVAVIVFASSRSSVGVHACYYGRDCPR